MASKEAARSSPSMPSMLSSGSEGSSGEHESHKEKNINDLTEPPSKPVPSGPPPVPDGGLTAWLQVAGSFCLFFNTWGNLNTFGVFQNYYESEGSIFHESSSNIAWIGAVQAFLVLSLGIVSGPVFDRGHLRILLSVGSFFVVFGYMMLSLCETFWQTVLAQGFCIGIGGAMLFVPAVAIIPTYFRKHIGLAMGLAAAGSSMGGVIYPIVFYRLIGRIGFGWTTRVLGFIALATLIVPVVFMKMRIKPPKPRSIIDWTVFTDWPFLTFVGGCFLGFTGFYVLAFYISFFGAQQGITDVTLSFYLIPILNAASVFGRTVPNAVSDSVGSLNLIGPGSIVCGILILCLLAVKSVGGIVVITLLFGFFSGVFIALPPVCFAILTKDKSTLGTRFGMAFGVISLAVLLGGPASGAILGTGTQNLNWTGAWIYGGVLDLAAGAVFITLRMWKAGWKFKVKI